MTKMVTRYPLKKSLNPLRFMATIWNRWKPIPKDLKNLLNLWKKKSLADSQIFFMSILTALQVQVHLPSSLQVYLQMEISFPSHHILPDTPF